MLNLFQHLCHLLIMPKNFGVSTRNDSTELPMLDMTLEMAAFTIRGFLHF